MHLGEVLEGLGWVAKGSVGARAGDPVMGGGCGLLLEGLGWDAEDVDGTGIVDDSGTIGGSEQLMPDCCIAIASE